MATQRHKQSQVRLDPDVLEKLLRVQRELCFPISLTCLANIAIRGNAENLSQSVFRKKTNYTDR